MMALFVLILLYLLSLTISVFITKTDKKLFKFVDRYFLFLVIFAHTLFIAQRAIVAGRIPLTDTYETLLVFSWLAILIGLILYFQYKFLWIKVIATLSACFILFLSMFISSCISPLMPSLKSSWIFFHVFSYFIAYASFAIGFGFSLIYVILYLMKNKRLRYQDLLQTIEGLIFRIIDIGFPFLTVGIAAGAVWANISWGRFWSWDAKEVWALVTWLIYSGCLHLRHSRNLSGIYAAVICAIGFIAIIFTYIGVNLLFPATIHSYS